MDYAKLWGELTAIIIAYKDPLTITTSVLAVIITFFSVYLTVRSKEQDALSAARTEFAKVVEDLTDIQITR